MGHGIEPLGRGFGGAGVAGDSSLFSVTGKYRDVKGGAVNV